MSQEIHGIQIRCTRNMGNHTGVNFTNVLSVFLTLIPKHISLTCCLTLTVLAYNMFEKEISHLNVVSFEQQGCDVKGYDTKNLRAV